jgi:hypothetical protein
MVIEKSEQKTEASEFFSQNLYQSTPEIDNQSAEFQNELREKVLNHYNNIYYSKEMDTKKPFWKKWQVMGSAALALVLTLTIGYVYTNQNNTKVENNENTKLALGAEIAYAEGDLEIEQSENVWSDVTANTSITEGSSFRIAGEGRAIFNLDDGSSVRLASDSGVTFTSLNPHDIVITNDNGEIYTRVVKAERSFAVVTPDATYKSLGTAYKTVNTKNLKGVYVYHSDVEVKLSDKDVVVKEGKKYLLKASKESDSKKLIQISDKEIKDDFVQWNKEQDSKEFSDQLGVLAKKPTTTQTTETKPAENVQENDKEEEPSEPAPSTGGISLSSATGFTGKFKVQWTVNNLDVSGGFKVVYNKTGAPSYPYDSPTYLDGSQRSATISGLSAGTYYVKVCRYTGSGCDSYSNQGTVTVTADVPYTPLSSINLSAGTGGVVNWSVAYQPKYGYKLVWSTTSGPVYPGSSASFYEPHKTSGDITWSGATAGNTYFVRICEYMNNGTCGVYSNEIQVTL